MCSPERHGKLITSLSKFEVAHHKAGPPAALETLVHIPPRCSQHPSSTTNLHHSSLPPLSLPTNEPTSTMFRRALVRSLASKSSTAAAASAPRSILPPVTRFSVVTNFNKSLPNSARAPPPPPPPPHASLTNPTHFPHPSPRCRIDGPLPGRFSDDEIFVSLPVRVRDHAPLGVTFKVDIEGRLELGAGGCGKAAEVGVGRKVRSLRALGDLGDDGG